jgi:hypothetical protein
MPDLLLAALGKLTADGFKAVVRGAIKYATHGAEAARARDADLTDAYEVALRLMGSLLYETRSNVERVRWIQEYSLEGGVSFAPFDFTVSDALMPELCKMVPTPEVLENCRLVLAALRRVDFFQRAASNDPAQYAPAIGFAQDALEKGIVDRFNGLLDLCNRLAPSVFQRPDWDTSDSGLFPARIDPSAKVDHSLI